MALVPMTNSFLGLSSSPDAAREVPFTPSTELVQVHHVSKSFDYKAALKDISFLVPAGQICGLLGPNGAGKTTLFRLLMGILRATEGKLIVDGLDAFDDRIEVMRRIGFLPDEPVFYSYLSGREILELSAAMHGLDVSASMDRLSPIIARLLGTREDGQATAAISARLGAIDAGLGSNP
jgi:ABC-2 type transport system ATP-binding protein